MDWKHILYGLIITLLYIPMVFLGATTVFPDDGQDWFEPRVNCFDKAGPYPTDTATIAEREAWNAANMACQEQVNEEQRAWNAARQSLEAKRYVFVTVLNLIFLAISAFITALAVPVAMGLFAGSTLATFIATLTYFDSANAIGFGLLVLVFFVVVYFVSKATRGISPHKNKNPKKK